jgi:hypothetical protein
MFPTSRIKFELIQEEEEKGSTSLIPKDQMSMRNRVTRSVESERLWSGIEELGLLIELLNFHVKIPTLKCSNSTIKVGFSNPLQGKTTESHNSPTT